MRVSVLLRAWVLHEVNLRSSLVLREHSIQVLVDFRHLQALHRLKRLLLQSFATFSFLASSVSARYESFNRGERFMSQIREIPLTNQTLSYGKAALGSRDLFALNYNFV